MRRTPIVPALITVLAGLSGLLAGCGGEPGGTGVASAALGSASPSASATVTAAPTATSAADRQEQGRKFAKCMREHGVPMEDPDPDGGGLSVIDQNLGKDKVGKAMDACRAYAPFKDRKELKPEEVEQLRRLAQCMRENGVDMPDPNPDGTLPSGSARNFDRDDPAFKKAIGICGKSFTKPGAAK
ncbi:hypothetical protein [Nonomuraea zeae]|uniref:Lipoprotein n=1 Tax=Nonomuraea zeae TaxID=1642303 RepID=A0A5S4G044_9ACTN|nr:hypothetical protein [Nonomuraea zeae]TMR26336.1 hypothetical protein ETD85_42810 [Nonomuraea zeae]